MTVMTVLLLGMSSAIVLSARALPTPGGTFQRTKETRAALELIASELPYATEITELTPNSITFTVADRGHGLAGPETIRYLWSGTAGDPLIRQYNDSDKVAVATGVTRFTLAATTGAGKLTAAPRVGVVLSNPLIMTSDERARIDKLAAWGFTVVTIGLLDTQASFDAALATCDVLYIPEEATITPLLWQINNPSVGVVNESAVFFPQTGISSSTTTLDRKSLLIKVTTHDITSDIGNESFSILDSELSVRTTLNLPSGTVAVGATPLVETSGSGSTQPSMYVIDIGGLLHTGVAARSRRVAMPWGGALLNPLTFSELSSKSRTVLKRALVWAAAPPVYTNIRIQFALSGASAAYDKTTLLNTPRLPLR